MMACLRARCGLGWRRALCVGSAVYLFVAVVPGAGCAASPEAPGVTKTRLVAAGTALDLFLPESRPAPLVVLSHGFARSAAHHSNTARHLAGRGFAVAVPEDTRPKVLAALVQELVRKSGTAGEALAGCLDPQRIGLAGHSAGGAASVEAAVLLQETATPPRVVCLLDGVPRRSTLRAAAALRPVAFVSLRAEPSSCNANGSTAALLARLPFPVEDVIVTGSTHCDQENPSDALCALACGAANTAHQTTFRDLLTACLADALLAGPAGKGGYSAQLARLEAGGIVRRVEVPSVADAPVRP